MELATGLDGIVFTQAENSEKALVTNFASPCATCIFFIDWLDSISSIFGFPINIFTGYVDSSTWNSPQLKRTNRDILLEVESR